MTEKLLLKEMIGCRMSQAEAERLLAKFDRRQSASYSRSLTTSTIVVPRRPDLHSVG
jgi:hypothetical protein